MGNKIKRALFYLLAVIVFLPMLQHLFHFIDSGKLNGAMVAHPHSKPTLRTWWDGSYQQQQNSYLNDSVGFRPDLVRLSNQLDYSLFKVLHAGDVYVGTDNNLISKGYVDAYYGRDFMGTDTLRKQLLKLKKIQDTLHRLGKTFVFAYAPSKVDYYPDDVPLFLRASGKPRATNFSTFQRIGDSLGIHQLDYNAWFLSMKGHSKNALYSKQGVHWSVYGGLIAADSFIKFIAHERHLKMPALMFRSMQYTNIPRSTDNDLAATANLVWPMTSGMLCYPHYYYSSDSTTEKPKVIYIGDSFVWNWIYDQLMAETNSDWEFWNYFFEAWPKGAQDGIPMRKHDWGRSLDNTDCVVMLFAPINYTVACNVIDKLYGHYYPSGRL
jgi:hypothetical protein